MSVEKLEWLKYEDIRRKTRPQTAVVKFLKFLKTVLPVRSRVKMVEHCGVEREKKLRKTWKAGFCHIFLSDISQRC